MSQPGWYDDPDGDGLRWWDGSEWTDRRRDNMWTPEAGRYDIEIVKQGFWSGALSPWKVSEVCNRRAADGWRLVRSFIAPRRIALLFKRQSVFLVFEQDDR